MVSRTYHDPIHGAITLDRTDPVEALLVEIIDTPEFQRLRRIRQLGPASLTFHGAEGSRFTHSLGVMAVARRVFDRLVRCYPDLAEHRPAVLCGALLHDLGHGPYSHTGEEVFGFHHEGWTRRLLAESTGLGSVLERFDPHLKKHLDQVYRKTYAVPFVSQWVSSQLDCDRLDYLMRDSYLTGAAYGRLDLDRILTAIDYDPLAQDLVVHRKGLAAIEHYLVVRYFMHDQVYNHRKNLAAGWILQQIMARASHSLTHLDADAVVQAWLTQPIETLPLHTYLQGDDEVFNYHIHRWRLGADPILADLCRRYLDRDLLKAEEVTRLTPPERETLVAEVRDTLVSCGWDAQVYTGLRTHAIRGYTLYQGGIAVQTPAGRREISEVSPLVRTLSQAAGRAWVFYPRELAPQLTELFRAAGLWHEVPPHPKG